jgi:serine acetyltransferase
MKVVEILRPFQNVEIHPHTTNGSGVMITTNWGVTVKFPLSGQINYLDEFIL